MYLCNAFIYTAESILRQGDTDEFGRLLDYTWNLKQTLSEKITNPRIDSLYTSARKHGALGGKLLGSSGGGFLLLYVPEENQEHLKSSMPDLNFIKFRFDQSGTQIIHNDKE